jgi:hypothetical protein
LHQKGRISWELPISARSRHMHRSSDNVAEDSEVFLWPWKIFGTYDWPTLIVLHAQIQSPWAISDCIRSDGPAGPIGCSTKTGKVIMSARIGQIDKKTRFRFEIMTEIQFEDQ